MTPATIVHLIAATDAAGLADAEARGWERIGAYRFAAVGAGDARYDVRVARRMSDLHLGGGETLLVKGSDYDDGPSEDKDPFGFKAWFGWQGREGEKAGFDRLIDGGKARWFDPDAPVVAVESEPVEF